MPAPLALGLGALLAPEATAVVVAAAGVAVRAALPWLFRAATASTAAVVMNEATKEKDEAIPSTNTTTIVGKKKMNCGDDGKYGDMLDKDADKKFDREHVPSKKALQEAARKILKDNPDLASELKAKSIEALFGDKGLISKQGQTIAIPKRDHAKHSRTYGGRNNEGKAKGDADELQKAAEKDTKAIEDAEGKEMDDECFKKYQKAAKKIRDKPHSEYVKDLTDLIKDVISKQ